MGNPFPPAGPQSLLQLSQPEGVAQEPPDPAAGDGTNRFAAEAAPDAVQDPGPMRLEIDPVEQPTNGAGRAAPDRRGSTPAAKGPEAISAMNPIVFAMRRLVTTLMLVVALIAGAVLALAKMGVDLPPPLNTPRISAGLDYIGMRAQQMKRYIGRQLEAYSQSHNEESHHEPRKIVVTSPKAMDVVITERYVCQIHSRQHIKVCALDSGFLDEIKIQEGQAVKKGDLMFRIKPVLYETKYQAENAEARLAELEFNNTESLAKVGRRVVSENEVLLFKAKKDRARAKADQAKAELDFTDLKAPFDGIVDRLQEQLGSLIKEGDILTTLSDNSVMWVYFNVTEAQYLEYMAGLKQAKEDQKIELELANHKKFPESPTLVTVEGQFNNETGTIPFRADFPNPDRLLRHGQTGNVLVHRALHGAIVIPQRATFEVLDKRYVYVVGKDDVAHQRAIIKQNEMDDIFVLKGGLDVNEKIILEGIRQVRDGEKVAYEFRRPEEVLANQKNHAE